MLNWNKDYTSTLQLFDLHLATYFNKQEPVCPLAIDDAIFIDLPGNSTTLFTNFYKWRIAYIQKQVHEKPLIKT